MRPTCRHLATKIGSHATETLDTENMKLEFNRLESFSSGFKRADSGQNYGLTEKMFYFQMVDFIDAHLER